MRNKRIIIGTRGSMLARVQAAMVAERLRKVDPAAEVEIRIIVTSGDRDQQSHLSAIGGKGIFIRELEAALLDGSIDCAVHSFKDVTTQLASSLALTSFLKPESVCDVMVSGGMRTLDALPFQARIGTGSIRRKTLLLRMRPDLVIAEIRGNIDTRLAKVERGDYDAVMLSEAGLIRLGFSGRIAERFDPSTFHPAPGQGVITIETRKDDHAVNEWCRSVGDAQQRIISTAELTLLDTIGFDCRTPLGVHTTSDGSVLRMCGFFVDEASGEFREGRADGSVSDPAVVGRRMSASLLKRGISS